MPNEVDISKGIQLKLRGVFTGLRESCPQYVAGKCSDNEMKPCTYTEKPIRRCPVLAEVIKGWKEEYAEDRPAKSVT